MWSVTKFPVLLFLLVCALCMRLFLGNYFLFTHMNTKIAISVDRRKSRIKASTADTDILRPFIQIYVHQTANLTYITLHTHKYILSIDDDS